MYLPWKSELLLRVLSFGGLYSYVLIVIRRLFIKKIVILFLDKKEYIIRHKFTSEYLCQPCGEWFTTGHACAVPVNPANVKIRLCTEDCGYCKYYRQRAKMLNLK